VKFRSTAVGAAAAAAVAAALIATLASHPIATASAHPAYNSGDFLHPNDAGYRKIAASINLNGL
jgi:hypothetical protein